MAVTALDDADAAMEHKGEFVWSGDILRVKGDLRMAMTQAGASDPAELYLQCGAGDRAAIRRPRSFELRRRDPSWRGYAPESRAARDDARDLLAPVYGWFTEGFDTPDLVEAKALLDELS